MLVTESGIVTLPEQVFPSIRIPFTITNGFSFCLFSSHEVLEKACSPILVTEFAIVIDARFLQPENALLILLGKKK